MTGTVASSGWDVPPPLLFNAWKHHAGFLRHRIEETAAKGESALNELAAKLVVIGTELMDLYVGPLTPLTIAEQIISRLRAENQFALAAYQPWVASGGDYRVLSLDDESSWVLRLGDERDRFVHVHPGRWSPATRRVRANVLKTAVMAVAFVGLHGGDPLDRALVNRVRRDYLNLSPVGTQPTGSQGLGGVVQLLRFRPTGH
jgi:hypothetical protein